MTEKEMKLLHERMKKEDPRLLVLMEKCFDAGVMSGKEQAQRPWAGLTDEEVKECFESVPTQDCQNYEHWRSLCARNIEAKLKKKNT